ncbi:MAG: HAD family hydrolase [Desulfovibrio sp.]|nr:HAD family hydrolase [Desulfovibrio sp.]
MQTALVFDLDGTVLNTLDDIGAACNTALAAFGLPVHPLKSYEQMVGNGFYVLVQRALPSNALPMPEERFLKLLNAAKEAYAAALCVHTKPYPGIPEALASLAQKEVSLCVLSNKPEPMTQALIAHYFPQIPFARVYGGKDNIPLKPDPRRLLAMLDELGCDPQKSLFIGDSSVDMMTAHAAQMTAIGVAWGFRGAKELLQHGASRLLNQASELTSLV